MDPIKVDFAKRSEKGPDKKTGVVIPPEKKGLKIVINLILTAIFGAILYYFMLPVFNFKSILMYAFFGALCIFYWIVNYITSGALKTPDYAPYAKKSSMVPKIIFAVLVVVVAVGFVVSSVVFRANSYSKIITIEQKEEDSFATDFDEVDWAHVPVIDEATTATMANKAMSGLDDLGYVSQFDIQPNYYQINYKDEPVRVVPLKYANIIKWFTNAKNGLPGYVVVNARTQKSDFVEVKGGIKYSTADHFNHNVTRHVRFQYPTYLLDDPSFEIDETGHPYWIFAKLDMTIGLFGGKDVTGAIICDAVTGECTEYSIEDLKTKSELEWIDRVYTAELLTEQYNYYGRYNGGFWNSILGQKGTYSTTEDHAYLAMNDDVYMYTGVTSLTSDESITGFILINQRTKDAIYYKIPGAKEASAQSSAEGLVQQYGYTASFPLLLNIDGVPTYFMSLKDAGNQVKAYAMVNVKDYTTLYSTGTTIEDCLNKYVDVLADANIEVNVDTEGLDGNTETQKPTEKLTVEGTVADIKDVVIDGNTTYFITLEGSDVRYEIKAVDDKDVIFVKVGEKIKLTLTKSEGDYIPASALEIK